MTSGREEGLLKRDMSLAYNMGSGYNMRALLPRYARRANFGDLGILLVIIAIYLEASRKNKNDPAASGTYWQP